MSTPALQAGAAKAPINPPPGWPLQGFGPQYGTNTGIHDDLQARALVLAFGGNKLAVVALDLCGVPRRDFLLIAQAVETRTGISPKNISICCSHNHHSPAVANLFTANRVPSDVYIEQVRRTVVDAVAAADRRLEPVAAALAGQADNLPLNLNRRVEMPDHTVKDLPWNRHLAPNGVVDRQLQALHFKGKKGGIATLYNYASHAICVGEEFKESTADFPGAASALLEARGAGIALFLNGACGNVHPVGFSKDFREMERMGQILAQKTLAILSAGESFLKDDLRPAAFERDVLVPLKPGCAAKLLPEHLRAGKFDGQNIRGMVKVFALGEVALVFIPCEYFVEFGLELKARSPFRRTLVVSIANDYLDYAPTPEQFPKGGYEVTSTLFTEQSGRVLTDAALELLNAAHRPGGKFP